MLLMLGDFQLTKFTFSEDKRFKVIQRLHWARSLPSSYQSL